MDDVERIKVILEETCKLKFSHNSLQKLIKTKKITEKNKTK